MMAVGRYIEKCPFVVYELDPSSMQFTGPRAASLEQWYSLTTVDNPTLSRRGWYDVNVWDVHRAHMKNPFVNRGTRQRAGL